MTVARHTTFSRRQFLGAGALVVSFSLLPKALRAQEQPEQPKLPGSLQSTPMLDAWIRIDADGRIEVFTGKAELGQGIRTAILQVAAEQLQVEPAAITMHTASTTETPNEGYTAGSNSMADSGTAILHAAAQVRNILRGWAAEDLGVYAEDLKGGGAAFETADGKRRTYAEIVAGRSLNVRAEPQSDLIDPATYKVMGQFVPRLDIPPKLTGAVGAFVQDLRPENMVHARVVRPPNYGATLTAVDTAEVEALAGVIGIVRNGSFLAIVAESEYVVILAMRMLSEAAQWKAGPPLPDESTIYDRLTKMTSEDKVIDERGGGTTATMGGDFIEAEYRRPYTMHGAIGPSCAVAQMIDGHMTIWTHSQGVYPLRATIVNMLGVGEGDVDCIQVDGSGCYGHNGADDVVADAALIARAMPGRPIRVQWMREDEHGWEPFGSAMLTRARGAVDSSGKIVGWNYDVWSMPHATRPGGSPNNLMPAWFMENPAGPPAGFNIPQPSGGGDRNAVPTYALANTHIVKHYIPEMPIRVSALRSLGGYMNVFSVESFMDELALKAGVDPVQFRLNHLDDPRARDVVSKAAEEFGWDDSELPPGHGRGFGYVRYENLDAYCAVAMEVRVDSATGEIRVLRVVAADDSGDAVSPDGIKNQIEGGIIQSISWTLYERVTHDEHEITSRDWSGYPILRFDAVPDSVEVHVINRPGQPFLGTGEAAQGPTGAALANAVANATGVRIRELPLTPERVRAALLAQEPA